MNFKSEYMKYRRRLQQANVRSRKKYGYNLYKIPKIPKRITQGSIRRLSRILSKTPTVKKFNQQLAGEPVKKTNKKRPSKTTTKKKQEKKVNDKSYNSKKYTKAEIEEGRKKVSEKLSKGEIISYLPQEKDIIVDNVASVFYSAEDIDHMISVMNVSSRRGNNTHRQNVYDLSVILRTKYDQAVYEFGEAEISRRLQFNADTVEEAVQTIEGYYKDSDEEQLKEAIDKISELISIIQGYPINENEAKTLEDLYNDTMDYYTIEDEAIIVRKENILVEPQRKIIDKQTGELMEYVSRPLRLYQDPDTGEILNYLII